MAWGSPASRSSRGHGNALSFWPAGWRLRPTEFVRVPQAWPAARRRILRAHGARHPCSRWSVARHQGAGQSPCAPPVRRCADGPHPAAEPPDCTSIHARCRHPVRVFAYGAGRDRPRPASSTRTVLALQGRHRPGWACSTRLAWVATVSALRPSVKAAKGLSTLRVRPPGSGCCSNTLTWCPACTRVRAQAMPATPAPTMAMWRGALAKPCGGRRAMVGGFGHGRGFLAEVARACTPLITRPAADAAPFWIKWCDFHERPACGGTVQLFQPPRKARPGTVKPGPPQA
jgi:hypothetical protein